MKLNEERAESSIKLWVQMKSGNNDHEASNAYNEDNIAKEDLGLTYFSVQKILEVYDEHPQKFITVQTLKKED